MSTVHLRGIPVSFPFEPYEIQKDYMEKVIECLQNETNGVLESPTGTGKTLSLLCSSLAWLNVKKAQLQAQFAVKDPNMDFLDNLKNELNATAGPTTNRSGRAFLAMPTIIYASRTHSQLTQAMQELKRTSYNHMKASVLGSRDQMCIHPEVSQQPNHTAKVQMCRMLCKSRSCYFFNRVEKKKDDPDIRNLSILDIEDIVKIGTTQKFCPYYMAKELKQQADIIFMPYNYLLDPRARKALGVELANNVIILDEAHNIERICEDAASLQIRTTDIVLCIEEVTEVMKALALESDHFTSSEVPKDFTAEELATLKEMLLLLEKAIDSIPLKNNPEGTVYEGTYMLEILAKANISEANQTAVIDVIDKIVQFLTTVQQGPFARKGNGLSLLQDLLTIVFSNHAVGYKERINKCYKVHIEVEQPKKQPASKTWLSKTTQGSSGCRILSYWCFSPGYGMTMLMDQGIRCVILTSGTLAPLKPLISELELIVNVRLENPHIVTKDQICVKIITKGPDGEILNSSFQNRNNPNYIASLGRAILNITRLIPDGLLIFFPSYPILAKCQESWQNDGTWNNICQHKQIFVEPRNKDAFSTAMHDYYSKINDPTMGGAAFMAVCRGKVSEGLDFADMNGRAVIVTGLPYPPLKDPRIILKKRYLDGCHSTNKDYLSGDDWYSLEASRAINQAIGRVIRHQHDYGAILLLDTRFNSFKIKNQMSMWLRDHIEVVDNFGFIVKQLRTFFRNAEATLPSPKLKPLKVAGSDYSTSVPVSFDRMKTYKKKGQFDFSCGSTSSSLSSPGSSNTVNLVDSDSDGENKTGAPNTVKIHQRKPSSKDNLKQQLLDVFHPRKKKKIVLVTKKNIETQSSVPITTQVNMMEYMSLVSKTLGTNESHLFLKALSTYRDTKAFQEFTENLDEIFIPQPQWRFVLQGLLQFVRECDKKSFETYWEKMKV